MYLGHFVVVCGEGDMGGKVSQGEDVGGGMCPGAHSGVHKLKHKLLKSHVLLTQKAN